MGDNRGTDVWGRFVSGEHSCFEEIFRKYYRTMYAYGLKMCHRPNLVEDCIQDLFQNIWERRFDLDHIYSARVYLFVSLRRKILNRLRLRNRDQVHNDDILQKQRFTFGIEEIIIRDESEKQQKEALHSALNRLSKRQREVIYLYFYNGMSYREIEHILSINRQSVYNLVHRAIVSLRAHLDVNATELVKTSIMLILFVVSFI